MDKRQRQVVKDREETKNDEMELKLKLKGNAHFVKVPTEDETYTSAKDELQIENVVINNESIILLKQIKN